MTSVCEELRELIDVLFKEFHRKRVVNSEYEILEQERYKEAYKRYYELIKKAPAWFELDIIVNEMACYLQEAAYKQGFKDAEEYLQERKY